MADSFVIMPASIMCLVFWYCLTMDKIKASFKRDYDERNNIVQTHQGHRKRCCLSVVSVRSLFSLTGLMQLSLFVLQGQHQNFLENVE